ncbi:MAG: DUF4175 domain-containing protein, partial [Thermoleophilia bacterium]|nr:DUF4175 domain-containing protein [Thermoleophilia bacterium]
METQQLTSRIARLRGQVRRLLAVHGLGRTVAVVVPLILLACLADWLFHLDSVARSAILAGLAGAAAWLLYRHVLVPLFVRFGDLDIALKIEERWPGLYDRLSSTIEFLKVPPGDDRHGSPALREATVKQALAETEAIDFREVVESRPAWRAMALATTALAIATGVGSIEPQLSKIALRRLFLPFGRDAWPQLTHLAVVDAETPRKVARGEPFTLAVAV